MRTDRILSAAVSIGSCSGFFQRFATLPFWSNRFNIFIGKSSGSPLRLDVSQIPYDVRSSASGEEDPEPVTISFIDVHDLLLQRAIQTEILYFSEMQNDAMAKWLVGFMNHTHLDCGTRWHCVVGMKVPMYEYLNNLLQEPPQLIEVEVSEDHPTLEMIDSTTVDLSGVSTELLSWSAAASSRRRNPYLETKTVTYTEDINPQELGNSLMDVASQLGREWCDDLAILIAFDDRSRRRAEIRRHRRQRKNAEVEDLRSPPPFEGAERQRSGSTPLRRQNFDLLERATTIMAVKSLESELAVESRKSVSAQYALHWLSNYYKTWWSSISGVVRGAGTDYAGSLPCRPFMNESICETMLGDMELKPPMFFGGLDDGSLMEAMIDPYHLAERIREHRQLIGKRLIQQLEGTDRVLTNVRRYASRRALLKKIRRIWKIKSPIEPKPEQHSASSWKQFM